MVILKILELRLLRFPHIFFAQLRLLPVELRLLRLVLPALHVQKKGVWAKFGPATP